jgi:hypothetical protein
MATPFSFFPGTLLMPFVRSLIRWPLITLTLTGCAILILLDCRGYFLPPRHPAAEAVLKEPTVIEGIVRDYPETRKTSLRFNLMATSVNGTPVSGLPLLTH